MTSSWKRESENWAFPRKWNIKLSLYFRDYYGVVVYGVHWDLDRYIIEGEWKFYVKMRNINRKLGIKYAGLSGRYGFVGDWKNKYLKFFEV